jgi:hypothetical protein
MKKLLLGMAILVLALLALLTYEGIWTKAQITRAPEGGYTFMGIAHRGAYHKIGTTFEKLKADVAAAGIVQANYGAIYYDDPKTVAEDSLRSFAAVVVSNPADRLKLANLAGFEVVVIPASEALVCDLKTADPLGMIIAVFKAYPAFENYFKTHPEEAARIAHTYELYHPNSTRFVFQLQ